MSASYKKVVITALNITITVAFAVFIFQLYATSKGEVAIKTNQQIYEIKQEVKTLQNELEQLVDENNDLALEVDLLDEDGSRIDHEIPITDESVTRLKSNLKLLKENPSMFNVLPKENVVNNIIGEHEYELIKTDNPQLVSFYAAEKSNQQDVFVAGHSALIIYHDDNDESIRRSFNMMPVNNQFDFDKPTKIDIANMFDLLINE